MTAYTSLVKLMEKLMSETVNKMFEEGDGKIVLVCDPKTGIKVHVKDEFHSFYKLEPNNRLYALSDWGYTCAMETAMSGKIPEMKIYGLRNSNSFVRGIAVDTSQALKVAGFSYDYGIVRKNTEWGYIETKLDGRLKLDWKKCGYRKEKIHLIVLGGSVEFLLRLDKLAGLNPIKLGLVAGETYIIRYKGGSLGLEPNLNGIVTTQEILKYYKLLEAIRQIR